MRVAIVSGPRSKEPMGMELAELRLLQALRAIANEVRLDVRVVGGRGARRHARRADGRWIPARRGSLPSIALAGADLVHLLGLDLPPPHGKPFVATVHDLAPLRYDDEGALPPWSDEIIKQASLLLTPSAFTAAELSRYFGVPGAKIRVVGSGPALDARHSRALTSAELKELGIQPPFVLRYGGYTKRKNVSLLLDAWTRVNVGTLVLAGPPQRQRATLLAEAPSLERVVVLDYVPAPLLSRLLRSAAALVSTSTYEGFGLPPLEALAAGTPVVALSSSFVREVCGDAALLVEADAETLAEALRRLLGQAERDHEAARRPQRAASFTWSTTAGNVMRAYADALGLN